MYHFIYECTKKSNLIAHQDNVNNKNIYKKMEYLTVLFELDKKKKTKKNYVELSWTKYTIEKPKQIVDTKIDEPRYKSSTFRIDCWIQTERGVSVNIKCNQTNIYGELTAATVSTVYAAYEHRRSNERNAREREKESRCAR